MFFPYRYGLALRKIFLSCQTQQRRLGRWSIVVSVVNGIIKDVCFALHSLSFLDGKVCTFHLYKGEVKVIIQVSQRFRKAFCGIMEGVFFLP